MSVSPVRLTVLYDARCKLCQHARAWLAKEPQLVELTFLPAASARARQEFAELDLEQTLAEVTVVDDQRQVYRGAKAWVMCLWALNRYRGLALELATPEHLPKARRVVAWVSKNRFRLGRTRMVVNV